MSDSYNPLANCIRALTMDAVQAANSGHPGMPMGMADIATVLFTKHLQFDVKHPEWPNRDRFVLSNGHGSMLLYSLAYLLGYDRMQLKDLKGFRQLGGHTHGHPELDKQMGIETTTGPLGQGIGNAVGMALAERHMNAQFGDIINHYTYAFCGDGCLMEGISQEAISLAGHLKLNKLILLFDDNDISIDGAVSLASSEDQLARFQAAGWNTSRIDGHNHDAIDNAIQQAKQSDKPTLIACKTIIGKGAPNRQGTAGAHGAPLGAEEIAATRAVIGWTHDAFEIPDGLLQQWRTAGKRGHDIYHAWDKTFAEVEPKKQEEFIRRLRKELPEELPKAIKDYKQQLLNDQPNLATRKSSQMALEVLTKYCPELIGGSADLTGSNLTKTGHLQPLTPENYGGQYIYYGIREHGMAAIMNGLALYGGLVPFGGTFLVFADYCRPSIRLAALMQQQVIYVMTHDSIGLGEDGPTHQPVEHLASLRAIPNLLVFRPADAIETLECWELSLITKNAPSLLSLSRQNLPAIRSGNSMENKCARGGYVVQSMEEPDITLLATGSEVSLALEVAKALKNKGMAAQVSSMPCLELFDEQDYDYREEVLGEGLRVAIEAASAQSWYKYADMVIGMDTFGESGKAEELFKHFGFEVEQIVSRIEKAL